MKFWPQVCPVCRGELPERGNRRVYVPWKRGFRLVHAGACFEAIDAQGVLDVVGVTSCADRCEGADPVVLVRMRRLAGQLLADRVQLVDGELEHLRAVGRAYVAALKRQPLLREDAEHGVECSREQMVELCRRLVAGLHDREVSAPTRTAVI